MSDELLHAMSTKASLSMDQFNGLFSKVYRPVSTPVQDERGAHIDVKRQLIRSLDALGFCEFDYENRRVHMCPPTLVLLPAPGTPRALFTGARAPAMIRDLRQAVQQARQRARITQQPPGRGSIDMPASIVVEAVDKKTLAEIGREAGIDIDLDEPSAWKLANLSASMREILASCAFESRQEPNWPRRVFREDQLMFSKASNSRDGSPWLAEYTNPVNKQRRHWYWQGQTLAEVDRDWGRYIVLSRHALNVLLYDGKLRDLAVPATTPLPTILARAAALSRGTAPSPGICAVPIAAIPAGHSMLVYKDVPQEIAASIASKLWQELVPVSERTVHQVNSND